MYHAVYNVHVKGIIVHLHCMYACTNVYLVKQCRGKLCRHITNDFLDHWNLTQNINSNFWSSVQTHIVSIYIAPFGLQPCTLRSPWWYHATIRSIWCHKFALWIHVFSFIRKTNYICTQASWRSCYITTFSQSLFVHSTNHEASQFSHIFASLGILGTFTCLGALRC